MRQRVNDDYISSLKAQHISRAFLDNVSSGQRTRRSMHKQLEPTKSHVSADKRILSLKRNCANI